ncbi:hypothetical protein Tco_0891581 [Tanacetum coccineum]|uniref:Uncharacterized protein n=1 Tax=Tanacetum coccineum TaxID=301880 RepID=A0ABQ5C8S3_9ASTR
METIHVTFDEIIRQWLLYASVQDPTFHDDPYQLNSGLAPSHVPATTNIPPKIKIWRFLFQPKFDEYLEQSQIVEPSLWATVVNTQLFLQNTSVSNIDCQDAPSTSLHTHPHKCNLQSSSCVAPWTNYRRHLNYSSRPSSLQFNPVQENQYLHRQHQDVRFS